MAENVATLWSKTGDFSAAVPDFPGVWDTTTAIVPADMFGANGDYIISNGGDTATLTNDGGTMILTVDDTDLIVGMYCRLEDVSVSNDPGYYRIDALLGGGVELNSTSLNGSGALSATDTVSFYIGGVSDAFDSSGTLQDELDLIGPRCGAAPTNAINNLDILCHASTATTLTATIDIDNIAGGTNPRVQVLASDSSFIPFTDGSLLEINTSTSLADGLFRFFSLSDNTLWFGFDFNSNSNAAYAINNPSGEASSEMHVFKNCIMRNSTTANVNIESANWRVIGCEITGGVRGVFTDGDIGIIKGCNVHDHTGDGIFLAARTIVDSNIIFDNEGCGINGDASSDFSWLFDNTIFGSGLDGVCLPNGANNFTLINNSSSGNGAGTVSGYGYNFGSTFRANISVFANNHSFDNLDGHCNLMTSPTSDSEFITFLDGDNAVGDPEFTNAAGGVFTFPATSPLYLSGVGGKTHIGAEVATQGGGAGGGVMPLSGLLG